MIALATVTIAVYVNLAQADTIELESRPINGVDWTLVQSVMPVGCAPGLRLGRARVDLTAPEKDRFFRVRGKKDGKPGPWWPLAQLWVVPLPPGSPGDVGGAADTFPVEGGGLVVIDPVLP